MVSLEGGGEEEGRESKRDKERGRGWGVRKNRILQRKKTYEYNKNFVALIDI